MGKEYKMVAKGLKVGDIFTEGKRQYKILTVNADGSYISSIVKKETKAEVKVEEPKKEEVKAEVEETKAEKTYTKTDINRMSTDNLTKLCKELGFEVGTGAEMKKTIIAKLGL